MLGPGPWRERLQAGFRAYRELAHTHQQLFALVGHRAVRRVETLRPIELALAALADAGLTPAQSVRAFGIANSFVYGYALSEFTGLAMQTALEVRPPPDSGQFPHLTEALPIARDTGRDRELEPGDHVGQRAVSLPLAIAALVVARAHPRPRAGEAPQRPATRAPVAHCTRSAACSKAGRHGRSGPSTRARWPSPAFAGRRAQSAPE